MTTYKNIPDTDLRVDEPLSSQLFTKLRDNIDAINEHDSSAQSEINYNLGGHNPFVPVAGDYCIKSEIMQFSRDASAYTSGSAALPFYSHGVIKILKTGGYRLKLTGHDGYTASNTFKIYKLPAANTAFSNKQVLASPVLNVTSSSGFTTVSADVTLNEGDFIGCTLTACSNLSSIAVNKFNYNYHSGFGGLVGVRYSQDRSLQERWNLSQSDNSPVNNTLGHIPFHGVRLRICVQDEGRLISPYVDSHGEFDYLDNWDIVGR